MHTENKPYPSNSRRGVKHARCDDVHDDAANVKGDARENDGLDT
jgi:hypothetical protein